MIHTRAHKNGTFYIGVSNSAGLPCGGILFLCVFLLKSAPSAPKSSDRGPPRALVFTSKS